MTGMGQDTNQKASCSTLVLIGGGGHALVVAEAALAAGWSLRGACDDGDSPVTRSVLGIPTLGKVTDAARHLGATAHWILCVGDLTTRHQLLRDFTPLAAAAASIVSVQAMVSPTARLGIGTFVAPRTIVHTAANVGVHCILNTGCIVEHECQIGSNTHIAPGVTLGGRVRIGSNTLIGLGATILPGVRIGSNSTVGAGAVVVRDVEDGETVVGVPAHHSKRAW